MKPLKTFYGEFVVAAATGRILFPTLNPYNSIEVLSSTLWSEADLDTTAFLGFEVNGKDWYLNNRALTSIGNGNFLAVPMRIPQGCPVVVNAVICTGSGTGMFTITYRDVDGDDWE